MIVALALALGHVPPQGRSASVADPPTQQAISSSAYLHDEDLLLYSVQIQQLTLSETLTAYGSPSDPLLPVGELARLLDLDVNVSSSERRITGTLGEARRPLTVDTALGVSRVGGHNISLDQRDFGLTPADIYIRASVLSQLLPARFAVDPEALTVSIEPTEKLPIQARLERIAQIRGLGSGFAGAADPALRLRDPYRIFTAPSFDAVVEAGRDTRRLQPYSGRYELRFAGDFAYSNVQGFVGSDERGRPRSARLLFERRSSEGELPLGATRISGGDVYTPTLALGPRSVSGRGISFTNIPLEEASVFRTIDLRGEMPAGYEVELYINDVLRNGQTTPIQGRYEFLNVPLARGMNVIRVVLYGLRGERTELVRIVNVGSGQLRKGELRYDFGAVQGGRELIELDPDEPRDDLSGDRLAGGLWYGLSDQLTLTTALAVSSPSARARRATVTAGLRTALAGFAVQADAGVDDRRGRALSVGIAGQPVGIATVLRHAEYRGAFLDETATAFDFTRPLRRHTSLTLDFSLPRMLGKTVPLSLRALRNEFADGGTKWVASARGSTTALGALLSGGFDYQLERRPESRKVERFTGNLAVMKFVNFKWQLRGSADYDLLPTSRLRNAAVTVDRGVSDRLSFRLGAGHTFSEQRNTYGQAGAVLRTAVGDLAFTGDYSCRGHDWGVGLRLAVGSLFDPTRGRYVLSPPGAAAAGNAVFRAFVDRDSDGTFSAGDEPVPNVALQGAERKRVTDSAGRAVLTGLGTASTGWIQADSKDVEQSSFAAPASRFEFAPRPGRVLNIAYPLKPVGEVYARLVIRREGEQPIGLSAVQVRLLGAKSEPLVGTTEYDGSVFFADVPLGTYRLELDPSQSTRLGMRVTSNPQVTVTADVDAQVTAVVEFEKRNSETPDTQVRQ